MIDEFVDDVVVAVRRKITERKRRADVKELPLNGTTCLSKKERRAKCTEERMLAGTYSRPDQRKNIRTSHTNSHKHRRRSRQPRNQATITVRSKAVHMK